MSKQILLFLLSCMLLPPGAAIAQGMTPDYRGDSTYTWVSNIPNCLGTAVCWHPMSASAGLTASRVYADNLHVTAITSSWAGYSYNDYPTNTWTYHPEWGSVYVLHYAGDGNLYGMTGSCASGSGHYFTKWTGSVWQSVGTNNCFRLEFSPAADGSDMVLGLDVNGYLWGATSYGTTGFTRYPMPSALTAISVAAISATNQNYLLVLSDNSIWQFNAGAWTQLPSTALQVTADAQGNVYMLGGQNYVNHWNGSAWERLSGAGKTYLANGGTMNVFAIGALSGGNSVYRFPDETVRHTRTLSGNTSCSNNNCGTAMHTGHVTAGWGTFLGTQVNSSSVTPPTNINISSTMDVVDPFTCFENPQGAGCVPSGGENVGCSQVGNIFQSSAGGGNTSKFEIAKSRVLATSHVVQPHSWKYTVTGHCDSISPDLNPGVSAVNYLTYGANMVAFDVEASCFSPTGGQPWKCLGIPTIGLTVQKGYATDPGFWDGCTVNP